MRASGKTKTKEPNGVGNWRYGTQRIDHGWEPSCVCNAGDPVPQTVLDPFLGAGTTLLVSSRLDRHGIGIDLSPTYAELARRRIHDDAPMFATTTLEMTA